jgi:hypothetical protein
MMIKYAIHALDPGVGDAKTVGPACPGLKPFRPSTCSEV